MKRREGKETARKVSGRKLSVCVLAYAIASLCVGLNGLTEFVSVAASSSRPFQSSHILSGAASYFWEPTRPIRFQFERRL